MCTIAVQPHAVMPRIHQGYKHINKLLNATAHCLPASKQLSRDKRS